MKKIIGSLVVLLFTVVLTACGGSSNDESKNEITIGASSTPHAEILQEAKPLLEEEGITLNIEQYQDYILPNDDLESGELDANYFQHIPYLEETVEKTGYDLDYIDGIHVEPMGIYSKNIKSEEEIPDGAEVIISRSIADHGRILALFEAQGLITLDENVKKAEATVDDIVDNPHNFTFSADVDAGLLPEMYESEADTLVAINTNYAIEAGLNPLEDALFIEDENSPYVNVVAVRSEDKDNEAIKKLVEVLHSEEIQNFILEKYEGAVVPVGQDNK
ncbi:MetQ/NlpA family ABC transporter substrate-binding protein [Oceanobacillus sp. Castelsardo]|uniref:MetQ/NlpA family ABC transporter substrate-binding protein n=1 Tax=Oceanobacillus sp. Castelsardo TaxID=1851204 RepID=UPI00083936EA|nr:MetQ/NlpA family ABC transporter substrate-binding protein [Oceanobacillus sp. Castelsardo]